MEVERNHCNLRIITLFTILALSSCSTKTENMIQVKGEGIFEKAFMDQSVNAFFMDSILYANGNVIYQLNGELIVNKKLESFSIVLDHKPIINKKLKTITSNFTCFNNEDNISCDLECRKDSLFIRWQQFGNSINVSNPLDSILIR